MQKRTFHEVIFLTISFIRTIILYLFVLLAFRLMGKRQLGELTPSELVVTMMISDLAAQPAHDSDFPLLSGIIPILSLVVTEIILSFFALKSQRFRRFLIGTPVVLVRHGHIVEEELSKLRFNLDDLFEEIRTAGYADLSFIDFMMLETNGKVSIIPKAQYAPPTAGDLSVSATQDSPASIVIADGRLRKKAMDELKLSEKWVYHILKKHKVDNVKDCLLLTVDQNKNVYIQKKGYRHA